MREVARGKVRPPASGRGDRVLLPDLVHEILDARSGDRVEGGARLILEDDPCLHSDRAGDAERLLLTTEKPVRTLLELVLDLVPERGSAKRLLDDPVHVVDIQADFAGAVRDVVDLSEILLDRCDTGQLQERIDAPSAP
ncbi:hypothetical protein JOD67_006329 [Tenggerimyces flavus]|nr:hypothetical protein [Tenggerimyces flavus]